MSNSTQFSLNRPIALIGLSGTGKSSVARALAERLSWPLCDTDTVIIRSDGRSVEQIFREDGEPRFRELEHEALSAALEQLCIVATGGGIVLLEQNRTLLHQQAYVVWLDAPTEILAHRLLTHDEARPLLADNLIERLTAQRRSRQHLYAALAQLQIATHARTAEQICEEILELIPENLPMH